MLFSEFVIKRFKSNNLTTDLAAVVDDSEPRELAIISLVALTDTSEGLQIRSNASNFLKKKLKVASVFVREKKLTDQFKKWNLFGTEDFFIDPLNFELSKLAIDYITYINRCREYKKLK